MESQTKKNSSLDTTSIKDSLLKLSIKQSLNLSELMAPHSSQTEIIASSPIKCLCCQNEFAQDLDFKSYLAHLLKEHKIVISDVDKIGHFPKFSITKCFIHHIHHMMLSIC